ncbi:MAG: aminotransferase class V-fold PLP-dependent enzyme [bacterium]|nr:aminotransferase class V-fold PLP-dependent enzyme [bacterium]
MKCETKKTIYLDNNATTLLDPQVLEVMLPYLTNKFGNPSSFHLFGQETSDALENARNTVADILGATNKEIFFTSGGTESNNWILKGIATANQNKGNHIITTAVEHHAVLDTCKYLEKNGFQVTYLPVDGTGLVSLDALKSSLTDQTILVSIIAANNEVGTLQPLKEIGEFLKSISDNSTVRRKIFFHSDTIQLLGKMPFNIKNLHLDAASFSAHKIYGPKGIGAAYIKLGTKIDRLLHGGYQEKNRRAGTENVGGIVGFGKACEIIKLYDNKLKQKLYQGLLDNIPDMSLNGSLENSLPNTLNLSFKHVEGEGIVLLLNAQGIAVSSGSACTSGLIETSHVLKAMNTDIICARGSIRFSLGKNNTEQEISQVIKILPPIIKRLRKMSPLL